MYHASELIKLSTSPYELQKIMAYSGTCTHTLHPHDPGATGLCFIIKVWLVTLTDENALTSNREHACPSEQK